MTSKWQRLFVHRWVADAKITESQRIAPHGSDSVYCRFTATICGFRNWKLVRGPAGPRLIDAVIEKTTAIRERIRVDDHAVFHEPNEWDEINDEQA